MSTPSVPQLPGGLSADKMLALGRKFGGAGGEAPKVPGALSGLPGLTPSASSSSGSSSIGGGTMAQAPSLPGSTPSSFGAGQAGCVFMQSCSLWATLWMWGLAGWGCAPVGKGRRSSPLKLFAAT